MSANNFILVKQIKNGDWVVGVKDADTGQGSKDGTFKTIEEAVKKANEIIRECEAEGHFIEYGVRIVPLEKSPSYTATGKIIETDSRINETDPHDSLRTGTLPVVEEIEKLEWEVSGYNPTTASVTPPNNEQIAQKLNEVIDAVNKMRRGK